MVFSKLVAKILAGNATVPIKMAAGNNFIMID
jgi:hypothetical protein